MEQKKEGPARGTRPSTPVHGPCLWASCPVQLRAAPETGAVPEAGRLPEMEGEPGTRALSGAQGGACSLKVGGKPLGLSPVQEFPGRVPTPTAAPRAVAPAL